MGKMHANGGYDPNLEAYDLDQLNEMMKDADDHAGGAIMKKLYRIHSRYKLEIDDNMSVDLSE